MLNEKEWRVEGRPGFLGKRRDSVVAGYDRKYDGRQNWRFAWKVGKNLLEFEEAIQLYEDAYFMFIVGGPESTVYYDFEREKRDTAFYIIPPENRPPWGVLAGILEYRNVYDSAVSNIESGTDYRKQENESNHYQDISIRRVLVRYGVWFSGRKDEFLQIRSKSKEHLGRMLSPGVVPFHIPRLVEGPELKGWWKPGSVEAFWQGAKVLVVRVAENL